MIDYAYLQYVSLTEVCVFYISSLVRHQISATQIHQSCVPSYLISDTVEFEFFSFDLISLYYAI